MKIISAGIQLRAVIIVAITSFLLLSASQAFAQGNFPGAVRNGNDHTFSRDLNAETVAFEAVNPRTQVAGRMTVTITGTVRGDQLSDGQSAVGSHLQAAHQASFSFVPYYPYSPSYSATVRRLQAAGHTTDDSIFFDFGLRTNGSDGSVQWFMLREVVTATEHGAQITFAQLKLPDALNTQAELPCGIIGETGVPARQ
jgi:hypothetical protein